VRDRHEARAPAPLAQRLRGARRGHRRREEQRLVVLELADERLDERLVGDALDDREAAVVRMRFGLEPYDPMTLREVGERLGLTRERVRQLENQALRRLMHDLEDVAEPAGR